ncbi:MAG: LytTR family transcriptional regulator DNA-binding domain-containing protein [Arcicella sp.]|jgi:DNA-binding LytR/AlgR family response regulator|nr:LytTR family transcriptional regulator DNA-binding domain-containing protein [Arcicella sp.]
MKKLMPHFCEIIKAKIYFPRTRKTIPLQEIIMLEGMINYTVLHLRSGRRVLIPRTLKLFEILLVNYDFLRTHRGFMINCEHLRSIDREGVSMILTNNLQAMVSRRRRDKVNERLHFQA